MEKKKTAVITFRTNECIKEELNRAAEQNHWSLALLVEQLCKNFVVNPMPHTITIKAEDLILLASKVKEEGCGGVELNIDFRYDEEQQTYYKELSMNGLECGGLGMIGFYDTAIEMSEEEIKNIP